MSRAPKNSKYSQHRSAGKDSPIPNKHLLQWNLAQLFQTLEENLLIVLLFKSLLAGVET